jgi:uncharacterized protein (TIGR02246 family)
MPRGDDAPWLERLHHDFVEAFRNNDLKALGAFFTDDALLLPPSRAVVAGREAIVAYWEAASRLVDLVFEATDVKMIGDSAFREAGNLLVVRRGAGRETRNVATKFVSLWVKVEEDWKLDSLTWNSVERPRRRAGPGAGPGRGRQGGPGGGRQGPGGGGRMGRQGGGQGPRGRQNRDAGGPID